MKKDFSQTVNSLIIGAPVALVVGLVMASIILIVCSPFIFLAGLILKLLFY